MTIDRRSMIKAAMSLAGASLLPAAAGCRGAAPASRGAAGPAGPPSSFLELIRLPTRVGPLSSPGAQPLEPGSAGRWQHRDVEVRTVVEGDRLHISATAPRTALERIVLRWDARIAGAPKVLGDHWERSYADLSWKAIDPARVLPWYFLTCDGNETHGYGVRTSPGALVYFTLDGGGVTLMADVRCGGAGTRLGERRLSVAEVTTRRGRAGESPFQAARAFCRQMCPTPRRLASPVYGINDWYYAYGENTADGIVQDARYHGSLTPPGAHRAFCVIDD